MVVLLKIHLFVLYALVMLTIETTQDVNVELNNKCTYSSNRRILNCVDLENMDNNLGPFITPATQMLFLRNSKKVIFRINHHIHQNYANLVSYQILDSQYFLVNPGSFLGLVNVQYMELHGNTWNKIEDDTFIGLRNLEVLNLANNQIKELSTNSFNLLKKLKSLDVSSNSIQTIPSHAFESLKELESLYINSNSIHFIQESAFVGLSSLKLLFLTNNSLENVNAHEFNRLRNLEHLSINFNGVKSITGRFSLLKLQFLQINNNELRDVNEGVFENCPELLSVDLSKNKLQRLTQKPFLTLSKLRHLNVYDNFVNRTNFVDLNRYVTIIMN